MKKLMYPERIIVSERKAHQDIVVEKLLSVINGKPTQCVEASLTKKQQDLLDTVNNGLAIIHPEKARFIAINKKMAEMFGYSIEELKGTKVLDIHIKSDCERVKKAFKEITRTGTGFNKRFLLKRKDTSLIFADLSAKTFFNKGNAYIVITVKHITSEKRVIKWLDGLYKAFTENLPEIVYSLQPDGALTYVNPIVEKITGFKPKELCRDRYLWGNHVHTDDREKVHRFQVNLQSGMKTCCEYRFLHKNNTDIIWFMDNAIPNTDKRGQIESINGVVIDITEKRKMYEQLLWAEKLSELGAMISSIAHEYNNLNTVILTSLQLALQTRHLPANTKTYIKEALQATYFVSEQTTRLRDFIRKKPTKREEVDIKKIIKETIKLVQHGFKCEGIHIVTCFNEKIPPLFVVPEQMSQVFLNIMINAQHAMIKSKEKYMTIEVGHESDTVYIAFTDTGCGIEERAISRIFEPFYTTKCSFNDETCEDKAKGTGLGLCVSDSIIKEHGGRIEVKSKVNVGSTFAIYLPVAEGNLVVRRKIGLGKEKCGSIKGAKILVLDDEAGIRKILKTFFKRKGCNVSAFEDGDEAFEEIEKNGPYDLAIIDLHLPSLDGYSFIKNLNHLSRDIRPEKCVITGKLLSSNDQKMLWRLGVCDIITKPFDNNFLYKRVYAALSQKYVISGDE